MKGRGPGGGDFECIESHLEVLRVGCLNIQGCVCHKTQRCVSKEQFLLIDLSEAFDLIESSHKSDFSS